MEDRSEARAEERHGETGTRGGLSVSPPVSLPPALAVRFHLTTAPRGMTEERGNEPREREVMWAAPIPLSLTLRGNERSEW